MKTLIGIVVGLVVIAAGAYWYSQMQNVATPATPEIQTPPIVETPTTTVSNADVLKAQESIGTSAGGIDIMAYHFGAAPSTSTKEIVFIGGLHGGYEWNTSLVAYQLINYLKNASNALPAHVRVTVIPAVNADGIKKVTGKTSEFAAADVQASQTVQVEGRFNGNTVDLNRNFDCDWKKNGVWQSKTVSGGSAAFSEPETQAIKTYIESVHPAAVVVWFSSAGGVFASNCHEGVLSETKNITSVFAAASGYPAHETWNYYEVTGDIANWLAKIKVPAISVLLTNHTDTEWEKNQKGIQALFEHYSK
jgi:hypothetical protein